MPASTIKYYDAIQLKIKTSSQWASQNPKLQTGEIGLESDTLRMKIGNGSDNYNALTYTDAELRSRIESLEEFTEALSGMLTAFIDNSLIGGL